MKERKETKPVKYAGGSEKNSNSGRQKMSSRKLNTTSLKVSWSNIQDQIAQFLIATGAIPKGHDVMKIKIKDLGYLPEETLVEVEVITKKEVSVIRY